MKASDVFSAMVARASPAGFFSFRSPSLFVNGPMTSEAAGFPKLWLFSAMSWMT